MHITMVEVTEDSCQIKLDQNIKPPYKNHNSYRNQYSSGLILEATLISPIPRGGIWRLH